MVSYADGEPVGVQGKRQVRIENQNATEADGFKSVEILRLKEAERVVIKFDFIHDSVDLGLATQIY